MFYCFLCSPTYLTLLVSSSTRFNFLITFCMLLLFLLSFFATFAMSYTEVFCVINILIKSIRLLAVLCSRRALLWQFIQQHRMIPFLIPVHDVQMAAQERRIKIILKTILRFHVS